MQGEVKANYRVSEVRLNIYHVGTAISLATTNSMLSGLGGGGVFHAGVEIDGIEWAFGGHEAQGQTGVFWCPPRGCCGHTYKETIVLGTAALSKGEIEQLLGPLKRAYSGPSYNLLERNCCHFAHDFSKALGCAHEFPKWVNRLAGAGATVGNVTEGVYGWLAQWGPKRIRSKK